MLKVKTATMNKDHKCPACGEKIPKGSEAVSCMGIDDENSFVNERFHIQKVCLEDFFEDWKSIIEKAQKKIKEKKIE